MKKEETVNSPTYYSSVLRPARIELETLRRAFIEARRLASELEDRLDQYEELLHDYKLLSQDDGTRS